MASNRNVLPGLDTKLSDLSVQGKTGFQVKQQFVTKTLIPKILTNILQMTAWKKKKSCTVTEKFNSTMYP